jgi:pimeloyl-ACP methyl ester carboxylesterase
MEPVTFIGLLAACAIAFAVLLYFFVTKLKGNQKSNIESEAPPGSLPNIETKVVPCHPQSLFCDLNERTVHYTQSGHGPHLVLIHGIAASLYVWRFIIPELSKHFTVTALDLPGFGFSSKHPYHDYGLDQQADNVVDFLDSIGIKEAGLVGSSMGGTVALWMAKKYPERFGRVAAISPSTNPGILRYLDLFPLRPLVAPIVPLAKSFKYLATHTTVRLFMSRTIVNQSLLTDESVSAYLRPFIEGEDSFTTLLKATRLIGDKRLPGELGQIKNPVLVLYGKHDRLVPYKYIEELLTHLPSSKFVAHPQAGHHSMEDDPQWVIENVKNFFSTKA